MSVLASPAWAEALCNDLFKVSVADDQALNSAVNSAIEERRLFVEFHATRLNLDLSDVTIDLKATSATFDYNSQVLSFPLVYFEINLSAASDVFLHEYSHALFEKYMKVHNRYWDEAKSEVEQARQLLSTLISKRNHISFNFKIEPHLKDAQLKELDEQIEIAEKANDFAKKKSRHRKTLMSSYHEFFADFMVVLFTGSKSSMRDSLQLLIKPQNVGEEISLAWRSFDSNFKNKSADWLAQLIKYKFSFMENLNRYHPYDLLAPTRSWAGANLVKENWTSSDKALIIQAILESIDSDHTSRTEQYNEAIEINPSEFNETLAMRIASELGMQYESPL